MCVHWSNAFCYEKNHALELINQDIRRAGQTHKLKSRLPTANYVLCVVGPAICYIKQHG